MIDFPASPTTGQTFKTGGITYKYDGVGWMSSPQSSIIPDAPSDGQIYGRKNAAWTPVVSGGSGVWIGDTAPTDTVKFPLWWHSTLLQLFVWYNDGTSVQWVETSADPATITATLVAEAPNDGKLYARKSVAWSAAGTVGAQVYAADTVAAAQAVLQITAQPSFRNLVINGDMSVAQYTTPPVGASGWAFDMWRLYLSVYTAIRMDRVSAVGLAGFTNFARLTATAANTGTGATAYAAIAHNIEGIHLRYLNWGTANAVPVTVSFWCRAARAGTYAFSVRNGNSDISYVVPFTLPNIGWNKIIATVAGPTAGTWDITNGTGIQLWFMGGASPTSQFATASVNQWIAGNFITATTATNGMDTNGNTFDIAGVQFEAGSAASPFEYRAYTTEMMLCQRYWQFVSKMWGVTNASTSTARMGANLPVVMRAAPTNVIIGTINLYDGGVPTTLASIIASYNTINMVEFDGSAAASFGGRAVTTYSGAFGTSGLLADARFP